MGMECGFGTQQVGDGLPTSGKNVGMGLGNDELSPKNGSKRLRRSCQETDVLRVDTRIRRRALSRSTERVWERRYEESK